MEVYLGISYDVFFKNDKYHFSSAICCGSSCTVDGAKESCESMIRDFVYNDSDDKIRAYNAIEKHMISMFKEGSDVYEAKKELTNQQKYDLVELFVDKMGYIDKLKN